MLSSTKLRIMLTLLLLAICGWPGPRLVVHTHESIACSPRMMREHLARFHPASTKDQVPPNCPHCHWVFYGDEPCTEGIFPHTVQLAAWWSSGSLSDAQVGGIRPNTCFAVSPDPFLSAQAYQLPTRLAFERMTPRLSFNPPRSLLCVWIC